MAYSYTVFDKIFQTAYTYRRDLVTISQIGFSGSNPVIRVTRRTTCYRAYLSATSVTFSFGGQAVSAVGFPDNNSPEGVDEYITKEDARDIVLPSGWSGKVISYAASSDSGMFVFNGYGQFTLGIAGSEKYPITVTRTSSPRAGEGIGALWNGATIYSGDTLRVDASLAPGYKGALYLNGVPIASGSTSTVEGNIAVSSSAEPMATLHVWNGESWDMYLIYVYDGTWQLHQVNVHDGSGWAKYY